MIMASIEKDGKGKPRYIRVERGKGPNGERLSDRYPVPSRSWTEARAMKRDIETDQFRGRYAARAKGGTFEAYAAAYIAGRRIGERTRNQMKARFRNHVNPHLGHLPITDTDLSPSVLQGWVQSITGLAPSYQKLIFTDVTAVLAAMTEDNLLDRNPLKAKMITRPKAKTRKITAWSAGWVQGMYDAMSRRYRIAVRIGAGLGLRQGEIFGLAADDVDFERGCVYVRRQVQRGPDGRGQIYGPPKHAESKEAYLDPGDIIRTVPLPASVAPALRRYMEEFPSMPVTLPWIDPVAGSRGDHTAMLIMTTEHLHAVTHSGFNSWHWANARKAVGIPAGRQNGMHALRHFYGSTLVAAGVPIADVADWMGHATAQTTVRLYVHPQGDSQWSTLAIDRALLTRDDGPSLQLQPDADTGSGRASRDVPAVVDLGRRRA